MTGGQVIEVANFTVFTVLVSYEEEITFTVIQTLLHLFEMCRTYSRQNFVRLIK
jgi:hypothetical protein